VASVHLHDREGDVEREVEQPEGGGGELQVPGHRGLDYLPAGVRGEKAVEGREMAVVSAWQQTGGERAVKGQ